ncbi:IclR family transcriptional regulator [Roseococcus sp. DSY-14]|uniref:IclR family transcriptional regulator n=1 Tax=Roseococcus sp. DSY-14 TaxID=3369650 RepID=UPI00387B15E1
MAGRAASTIRSQAEDDEGRQPLYAAPALEKGLDILELLSRQEAGLTRRDIAERLGRSVSEVFRMIEVLARRGYIVQDGDSYVMGMMLFALAHEQPPMKRLLKEALPRMDALAKATGQSCHMTMLNGPRQVVVAQVDPPAAMGFAVKIGAVLPLVKSASGRVLLAFHDAEEADRLMLLAEPQATAAERAAMRRTVAKVRAQGFAFMPSKQFSGLVAISCPVFDLRGRAIAALTVPYVKRLDEPDSVSDEEVRATLAEAAAALTARVGGSVPAHGQATTRSSKRSIPA